MKEISNIFDLKKDKIYYIYVKTYRCPSMKLKGKFNGNNVENEFIFMSDLEYINHHYDHLQFPFCKPILLRLWKVNGKLYRFQLNQMVEQIKEFPNLYEPCKIFEPENERVLVNYMMRNKIIHDPYFDYK